MRVSSHGLLGLGMTLLLTLGACGRMDQPQLAPAATRTVQQVTQVTWNDLLPGVFYHVWEAGQTEFAYVFGPNIGGVAGFNSGKRYRDTLSSLVPSAPQLPFVGYDFKYRILTPTILEIQILVAPAINVQLQAYNAQTDIALVTMDQGYGNAFWYGCRSTQMPVKYKVHCASTGRPTQ